MNQIQVPNTYNTADYINSDHLQEIINIAGIIVDYRAPAPTRKTGMILSNLFHREEVVLDITG